MSEINYEDVPPFKETIIALSLETGLEPVPALVHEYCKGLAVSMQVFGLFSVTHEPTGMAMSDKYERSESAILVLTRFALIAKANNFSWADVTKESIAETLEKISDKPVPFDNATSTNSYGERPMTIKEWIKFIRTGNFHGIVDEFPWEEENPGVIAMNNIAQC